MSSQKQDSAVSASVADLASREYQSGHRTFAWFAAQRPGVLAAMLITGFTVGIAYRFLIDDATERELANWRRRLSSHPAARSSGAFPLRAALQNRDAVILMLGYCATIWGAVGLRQWIVLFLGFCAGDPMQSDWSMLAVASLISLLGVPAGLLGVEVAIHCGLRAAATFIFLAAALVTSLVGFAAMLPFGAAAIAALAASFIAQGAFSNLTSGLLAVVVPRYAGATMALYSCIGFGGGFLGNVLFGVTLDSFGGASELRAWIMSFGTCGLAFLIGAGAMLFLSRHVERAPAAS